MPRIRVFCNTGFAGANHEDIVAVDDAEWAAMSEKEQEESLADMAQTLMENNIDYGAYVIDDMTPNVD